MRDERLENMLQQALKSGLVDYIAQKIREEGLKAFQATDPADIEGLKRARMYIQVASEMKLALKRL